MWKLKLIFNFQFFFFFSNKCIILFVLIIILETLIITFFFYFYLAVINKRDFRVNSSVVVGIYLIILFLNVSLAFVKMIRMLIYSLIHIDYSWFFFILLFIVRLFWIYRAIRKIYIYPAWSRRLYNTFQLSYRTTFPGVEARTKIYIVISCFFSILVFRMIFRMNE
jgi:hypothetical protein